MKQSFLLILISFFACNSIENEKKAVPIEGDKSIKSNKDNNSFIKDSSKNILLEQLLSEAIQIELPFYWDQNTAFKTIEVKKYKNILPDLQLIGYFKVKEKYAFIQLIIADDNFPKITILDMNGKTIDSRSIVIGKCHGDCGFECNESTRIDTSFNIYSVFSSVYQECDDNGNIKADKAEATFQEATGRITDKGKIEYEETEEYIYEPDSAEIATLGYKSEVFELREDDYKEILKIKQVNDSTINYWIHSDNVLCEFSYYGTAMKICSKCDGEIDEYNGEAYESFEYFPIESSDVIGALRISADYTKAIIKAKQNIDLDDCMPNMGQIILNKRR